MEPRLYLKTLSLTENQWESGSDPGGGGGGGAKGAEAPPPPPPPLQVNEMRNIHLGQNTNSHFSETSEKDTTA